MATKTGVNEVEIRNDRPDGPRQSGEACNGANTGRSETLRRDSIDLQLQKQGSASASQLTDECREGSQDSGDDYDEDDIMDITGEVEDTILDCVDPRIQRIRK